MWTQIDSVEQVKNEEILAYMKANPVESMVDLEDEACEDF